VGRGLWFWDYYLVHLAYTKGRCFLFKVDRAAELWLHLWCRDDYWDVVSGGTCWSHLLPKKFVLGFGRFVGRFVGRFGTCCDLGHVQLRLSFCVQSFEALRRARVELCFASLVGTVVTPVIRRQHVL
jgi:hypothetical protein